MRFVFNTSDAICYVPPLLPQVHWQHWPASFGLGVLSIHYKYAVNKFKSNPRNAIYIGKRLKFIKHNNRCVFCGAEEKDG